MSDKCFDNIRRSGALGHLTVVIFAPDLEFDRIITLGLEGCEVVAFNASRILVSRSAEMALANLTQGVRGHACQTSNFSPSNVSFSDG